MVRGVIHMDDGRGGVICGVPPRIIIFKVNNWNSVTCEACLGERR